MPFFLSVDSSSVRSKKSDVIDDPQIHYYTEVEKFTNMSKAESRIGASYGYN